MHTFLSLTRHPLPFVFIYLLLISSRGFVGELTGQTTHPSIFILKEQKESFLSLEDFRSFSANDRQGTYLKKILRQAEEDLQLPYIDPTIDFEGRDPVHLRHANFSYDMAVGI